MKYKNRLLKFIIFPVLILLTSIALFFISKFLQDERFFSVINPIKNNSILQNDSFGIAGEMPVNTGKIGTVIVHFQQPKSAKGSIIFTLTEEISSKTLYQSSYSMHDIYYKNIFPFGFPPVEQKRGEKYTFSITQGQNTTNFISLKNKAYPYEVLYQFDKTHILKDPKQTVIFIQRKMAQYGFHMLHSRNIIFYLFPVVLYFLLLYISTVHQQIIKQIKNTQHFNTFMQPSVLLTISIMATVSILFNTVQPIVLTSLTIIWILLLLHHKIRSETTFLLAQLFLMICPILIVSEMSPTASNAASWSFMLILIGSLQGIGIIKSKKFVLPFISYVDQMLKHHYHRITRSTS